MQGSRRQYFNWRSLAVILAGLGTAAAAQAASVADLLTPSAAESTETEGKPEVIEPVAPADIPTRADTDERFVQDVVVRAQAEGPHGNAQAATEANGCRRAGPRRGFPAGRGQ